MGKFNHKRGFVSVKSKFLFQKKGDFKEVWGNFIDLEMF